MSVAFLVASVRSGSTLLRLMLDAHPEISNPGECDFLFDQVDDDGRLPDPAEYAKWLAANRIFLAKKLQVSPGPYRELMDSFQQQLAAGAGVLVMNVHRHFERIPFVFPGARYIHLVRDPRDVARSCIALGWAGNVYHGADIWQQAELSWRRLRARLRSDQFIEVKYEDLINDVNGGLRAICRFLGVEYSEQMMSYATNSTYSLPDKALLGQWKKRYTPRELQLVEGKIGALLAEHGYEAGGHGAIRPGRWQSLQLSMQNRLSRARFQIRRYGWRLYLEDHLASRIGPARWQHSCQLRRGQIDALHLK